MGDTPDPLGGLISATIRDACRLSGFSKDALYALINDGSITSFLMGSRRFVVMSTLRDYIAQRALEPLRNGRAPIKPRHGRKDGAGLTDPSRHPVSTTT
jgi:hypothetical protein